MGKSEHDACSAQILDDSNPDDRRVLAELRADPRVDVIDRWEDQAAGARELLPQLDPELIAGLKNWAYYPWRRTLVSVLGPCAFRALRLSRNRNLVTGDEQDRLAQLKIGVVGLSVGHAIAYLLAAEGFCDRLRLADFDTLELSNLNRVPATIIDLGVNKAVVAARRIAELDPYLPVEVMTSGITQDYIDEFLDGLDIVVEECDSLDMKVRIREAARLRHIPVLMATSDRGLIDVERFDVDPSRRILHGLLGDIDIGNLSGLSSRDKVPYVLGILDAERLSARFAASLVEIDHTVTTWPQLAGDVALGAAAVAEAVRRIGLGESLRSGRVRIDIAQALDSLESPTLGNSDYSPTQDCAESLDQAVSLDPSTILAAAAIRAPSGGNMQPWHIRETPTAVVMRLAPEHTSTLDIGLRGSAVAFGAAVFNARVAAAALGVLGPVEVGESDGLSPLTAAVRLGNATDRRLAELYQPMLRRETNRQHGIPGRIASDIVQMLELSTAEHGARLQLLTRRGDIERAAAILGAADRIRYLTPHLHAEMMSELRWPADPSSESGIDIRSLGLDQSKWAELEIIRRPDVMAELAQWGAGAALGEDTNDRVCSSSGLGIVSVRGHTLTDYARGGSAAEAVWIAAQEAGLAVQPVSPLFLYAHNDDELRTVSAAFATSLRRMQYAFHELTGTEADEFHVLVLRFSRAPRTSVRSRRRILKTIDSVPCRDADLPLGRLQADIFSEMAARQPN